MSELQVKGQLGHIFIYLAGLATLVEIVLAEFVGSGPFPLLRYLAPLCGAAALVLIFWPMVTLSRHGEAPGGGSYMEAMRVVSRGPYALIRHPQYLGYICLNLTFIFSARHWLVFLCGVTAISLFCLQALREERELLDKFGPSYEAYMARVPRFNLLAGMVRLMSRRQ